VKRKERHAFLIRRQKTSRPVPAAPAFYGKLCGSALRFALESGALSGTTTDLGQALVDGKFDHVGKIKGPILRGLSARAPYFHNGSAQTLLDAVHFYETRFGLVLTPQEESDLVAFLSAL